AIACGTGILSPARKSSHQIDTRHRSVATVLALDTSQILAVPSQLPEASVLPSRLKVTELTGCVWPSRVAISFALATSHNLTVLSSLAEATSLPSELKATPLTASLWPRRVVIFLAAATSQRFTSPKALLKFVPPPPPPARVLPSGLKVTEFTPQAG